MSLRKYRLEAAFEKVRMLMRLRRPQWEALAKVHEILLNIPGNLSDFSPKELSSHIKDLHPQWVFGGNHPQMTFALATGVGKTRLMGAIAAYLFIAGQSSNFLLLAPRRAILRKLISECQPNAEKYIFVDPAVIPEPVIWHSGNLENFGQSALPIDLSNRVPQVFVFSPQSLTGDDKLISRTSEFSPQSILEFLKTAKDLVVLSDESHHLGKLAEEDTKAWTQAVRECTPHIQFNMTATPRKELGANVAYSYDLRTCLKEKLYTKDVRIIVRERTESAEISDVNWDHVTLDFALDRLTRKEHILARYRAENQFPAIAPVLLVCAEDTSHADELAAWLKNERGLSEEKVLVTHSHRTKTEEELERLVNIEQSENKVQVVINVYELTEGWDVTNVYVIAPLRRMGTFQGAIQTIGRGLRLPVGHRLGVEELDTLDVLCFGRSTLQLILNSALVEFGEKEDAESYVRIRDSRDEDINREEEIKQVVIPLARQVTITLPSVTPEPIEPDLDFEISTMRKLAERTAVEFDLIRAEVSRTTEGLKYEIDSFVRLVALRVIHDLRYLSEPLHRDSIEHLVQKFIQNLGPGHQVLVELDWYAVAQVIKEAIDRPYRKKKMHFRVVGEAKRLIFGDVQLWVPKDYLAPVNCLAIDEWIPRLRRTPICGWHKCVHSAVAFDTKPEYFAARVLDRQEGVDWWMRNDPPQVRIPTPIGYYEPDFVVNSGGCHLLFEIKRADLWAPPDSDARIKARAADAWCNAVSESGTKWDHWIVLDIDVPEATSFLDFERLRINVDNLV